METPPSEPKSTTTTSTEPPAPGETLLTDKDAKPPAAPIVPDKYEFKAPDNYTLDPKLVEAVSPLFKELGLTQDQAQKLVDFQTAQSIAAAKAPADAYAATRAAWQTETLSHPEIKAAGIETVKADIGRALNALGDAKLTADFREAMDVTGAGDNPAFVRAFWKLSQFIAEGKHVSGGGPSPVGQSAPGAGKPSAAKALYPKLS